MEYNDIVNSISKYKEKILGLKDVKDLVLINNERSKFLGKHGVVNDLFKILKDLPVDKRKDAGKQINDFKNWCILWFDEKIQELKDEVIYSKESKRDIDLNAPWHINSKTKPEYFTEVANLHPLTLELEDILNVFRTMGFKVFEGRALDTDKYIFELLRLPKGHPARELWDTFYTEEEFIPTTHTSNMQVRVMRLLKKPPIRAVIYSKCFRNEAIDAVHSHTMYQVEGLYIDKDINVGNMLATIKTYLEGFFRRKIVSKVQPAHFPFVEPGIEYMIQCIFCEGKGCKSCKYTGWLEVLGAGMIHPDVLRNGGIDPTKYKGFAWGLGLDRMVMNKQGIDDIRLLQGMDLRLFKSK